MTNNEISDLFSLLSKLMDIHGENSFKAKSYSNAAFQIDRLPVQLSEIAREQIPGLKGIGDSVAKKIEELLDTGTLSQLQTLLAKTPDGILQLMQIKGIGPKKIATIWHELGVESPGELLYACHENRLIHYKGFGEKTQQSIQEALEFFFSNQQKFLYASLLPVVEQLTMHLQTLLPGCNPAPAGDFFRQCDIIESLDLVLDTDASSLSSALHEQAEWKANSSEGNTLLYTYRDALQVRFICAAGAYSETVFKESFRPDVFEALQTFYPEPGLLKADHDAAVFAQVGLPYIPAALRDQVKSLELARAGTLPELITPQDIRGVIHNHSTWSDGLASIEEMARACIQKGYEYLVMSDHSVTSFYANGLSVDRIRLQHEEIDRLNEKLFPFRIFKSIECDILGEGQLDYDDRVLARFDLVIASVHQNLKMSEEKAMQRLLRAVENPYTRILGHPSGRLLLSRKPYPVDYETLLTQCAKHDVVVEINANPRRLDLDWKWIPLASEKKVMLSVNPDAHSTEGIDDIRFGVLSAQKGMLTASNNLSSLSLPAFEAWLQQKAR